METETVRQYMVVATDHDVSPQDLSLVA